MNDYIKNIANKHKRFMCLIEIAQNEEQYEDGWACDLVYDLKNDKYYLYDVDYHVTFKIKITHIQEAIDFTNNHFKA